jgi:hypothetical protein
MFRDVARHDAAALVSQHDEYEQHSAMNNPRSKLRGITGRRTLNVREASFEESPPARD